MSTVENEGGKSETAFLIGVAAVIVLLAVVLTVVGIRYEDDGAKEGVRCEETVD